ncbi:hypothetical protein J6590_103535 [Homalodisca vitripennis]|nr:hypothetical protein J6590_103535 [Homalodisca vitripennis]
MVKSTILTTVIISGVRTKVDTSHACRYKRNSNYGTTNPRVYTTNPCFRRRVSGQMSRGAVPPRRPHTPRPIWFTRLSPPLPFTPLFTAATRSYFITAILFLSGTLFFLLRGRIERRLCEKCTWIAADSSGSDDENTVPLYSASERKHWVHPINEKGKLFGEFHHFISGFDWWDQKKVFRDGNETLENRVGKPKVAGKEGKRENERRGMQDSVNPVNVRHGPTVRQAGPGETLFRCRRRSCNISTCDSSDGTLRTQSRPAASVANEVITSPRFSSVFSDPEQVSRAEAATAGSDTWTPPKCHASEP